MNAATQRTTVCARATVLQRVPLLLHTPPVRVGRQIQCAAAAAEATEVQLLNNLFEDLCKHCSIDTSAVRLQQSADAAAGVGLFASKDTSKGGTILRVPRSLCIIIDNAISSLTIPTGNWPRLSQGLMHEEALTWDLLQALALMDATAGDGDQFWELYADHFYQQPEQLTLPMCWPQQLLKELQHPTLVKAAEQQQARLRSLFPPEYMQPIDEGLPSYLQWAFACVRSRALQLGPQAFGMVPFVDIANHAADPNSDIRGVQATAGSNSSSDSQAKQQQAYVELIALKDVMAGQEVTISYSGLAGYTNQRFMAQYGFVPSQGNMADRLELSVPDSLQGATLRMSYLEETLGSSLILQAAQGKNPYIFAALKSLPITADDAQPTAATASAASAPGADSIASEAISVDSSSADSDNVARGMGLTATKQEKELATALLQQIEAEVETCSTSLREDEELLQQLQQLAAAAAADEAAGTDVRLQAAVRYRVERKRLLQACKVLLALVIRD